MIPFIVAGDPDLPTTEKALLTLDQNGADVIELGVPYSDPLADGPVIQVPEIRLTRRGTQKFNLFSFFQSFPGSCYKGTF